MKSPWSFGLAAGFGLLSAAAVLRDLEATAAIALAAPVGAVLVRRPEWLAGLVTAEMLLGGHGHLLDVGALSLRQVLTAALLAVWIVHKALSGDWRMRGGPFGWAVAAFLGLFFTIAAVDAAAGRDEALRESATVVHALLFFPLADLASRPQGVDRLVRSFLVSVVAVGLFQLAITGIVSLGIVSEHRIYDPVNLSLGSPARLASFFVRIFLLGSFFFPVALLLLVAARWAGVALVSRLFDGLTLLLVLVALVLGFTRGFWLGTVCGLAVLTPLLRRAARGRVLAGALVAAVLVPLALTAAWEARGVQLLVARLVSIADPDNVSVAYRLQLYPRLVERIAERPLLGYGFGVPVEVQVYFENSFLYYLVKTGFLGLFVVGVCWIVVLAQAWQVARDPSRPAREQALGAGLAAATVTMLLVTTINPFVNSPMGYFFLAWTAALLYGLGQGRAARRVDTIDATSDRQRGWPARNAASAMP